MTYKIFKKINMALLGIIFLGICAVAYADKIMDSVEKKVIKQKV